MVTITPSPRYTTYYPVVPTTNFVVNFPIFDNADIGVLLDDAERTDFTVSATYVDGVSTNAVVIMNVGITGHVVIFGDRDPARTDQFQNGGPLPISNFNYSLNRLEIEAQEARRDIKRSTKMPVGYHGLTIDPNIPDDATLMRDGDKLVAGPDLIALSASLIAEATAEANRAHDEADRAEDARDIAAGYASDAVSQGNVPIYATIDGLVALPGTAPGIPAGINAIRVNGYAAAGDGRGGFFTDLANGFPATFVSGGATSRSWYPATSDGAYEGPLVGARYAYAGQYPTTPGSGYKPGDRIAVAGGAAIKPADIGVISTRVNTAVVVSGGSGGANGPVTVTGTTGDGNYKFTAAGNIAGGALVGPLTIVSDGFYTISPTDITHEPVTGGGLVGAVVALSMGVKAYSVIKPGSYRRSPSNPVLQASTSGSGMGASFNMAWGPIAVAVESSSLGFGGGNYYAGGNDLGRTTGGMLDYPEINGELAGGNSTGVENTYVGSRAGGRATIGSFNAAFGHNAFGIGSDIDVTGTNNAAFGCDALRNPGSVSYSVAVGFGAMRNVKDGVGQNTAVGAFAGQGDASSSGGQNSAFGFGAMASAWTTAAGNTVVGAQAGHGLSTGSSNTLMGLFSGYVLSSGGNNALYGAFTGGDMTTGNNNCFFGYQAGWKATVGSQNVAFGTGALSAQLTGNFNVAIGYNTAQNITSGGANVIIGPTVGNTLTTGSSNILIGISPATDVPSADTSNMLNIGGAIVGDLLTKSVGFVAPVKLPSYTVATLPPAGTFPQCIIYVSNGASNKRMAVSDGTNWRWPDGTIVS